MNFLLSLWRLLLPILLVCNPLVEVGIRQESNFTSVVKSDDRVEAPYMDALLQKAIERYGKNYLDAEYQLRQGGSAAINTLQKNRNHPDPIARLMAECLLLWMQGKAPEYQEVLDYLGYIPKELAKTPVGYPPPIGICNDLSERFASRVADFLALRLVKEKDWPRWRVVGVLFYLEKQQLFSTTSALIRFAAETNSKEARGFAIEAIKAIADPDLKAKLGMGRKRLEEMHQKLPKELTNLAL